MKRRTGIFSIALLLVVAACVPEVVEAPSALATTGSIGHRPGSIAPAFSLDTLDGGNVSLADYKGHAVFINFWASWCAPCRAEMPEIIAAYEAHKDDGLVVLSIDALQEDTLEEVVAFVEEFAMQFPVLLDTDGSVLGRYNVLGLPTSVFIDAEGVIQAVNAGPMTAELIESYLAQILPAP